MTRSPELLVLSRLLGRANAVYFLERHSALGDEELQTLSRRMREHGVYGQQGTLALGWQAAGLGNGVDHIRVHVPDHVFPVVLNGIGDGLIVPVEAVAAPRWDVSDVFGTFAAADRVRGNDPGSKQGLFTLLRLVEGAWERRNEQVLPVRWLRALRLRILCPVHLALFEGRSYELPLLLAMLRGLGGSERNGRFVPAMGAGPVFASGQVHSDGRFGEIEGLDRKLEAFVRELGPGHRAVLTRPQVKHLETAQPALLEQVEPLRASNVEQLLAIESLHEALSAVDGSYHPSLNEQLVDLSDVYARTLKFESARRLSRFVLSRVPSPYYSFRFACDTAFDFFHRGQFQEGARYAREAEPLLMRHRDLFGLDDIVRLITLLGDLAVDSLDRSHFDRVCEEWGAGIERHATAPRRVEYEGTHSQVARAFREWDTAIARGRRAVELADQAYTSTAGRSRNYLVHALLAAARERSGDRKLLDEAERHLQESIGEWAPRFDQQARSNHHGFCEHLLAELHRLRGEPYRPSAWDVAPGVWEHPRLFTLLACARNQANDQLAIRQVASDRLTRLAAAFSGRFGEPSVFGLLAALYALHHAVLRGEATRPAAQRLQDWVEARAGEGFTGWRDRLEPLLTAKPLGKAAVDQLLEAVPFH